ncbi:MAG: hypothetical protein EBU42_11155 [Synechococcus sp.]|nr:hypothetical protein [Synechococcus sp.]
MSVLPGLKVPITFQAIAELAIKYVPGGVYKAMGAVAGVVKAQVRVVAAARLQVRLQLISSERQLVIPTFSAGMGLGGNLS